MDLIECHSAGFSLKKLENFTQRYSKWVSCGWLHASNANSLHSENENDVHIAIVQVIEMFQTAVIDAQNVYVSNIV
jgi:mannosyltransferase OCH1-like enzyme